MAFYPMFNINDVNGFVSLPNFSPNSWENTHHEKKKIFAFTNKNNGFWSVHDFGEIEKNQFANFSVENFSNELSSEILDDVVINDLVLFQLRRGRLEGVLHELPALDFNPTHWPEWRATIGFKGIGSRVSYQGEITPTPPQATLLTFHPFIQFEDINNYFVFVNIEKSPIYRWSEIEIFLSSTGKKIDSKKIRNNAANIISLDEYGFSPDELPVFYCKSMAGIPFGFGKSKTTGMLSLEHTHPPGSLTLHGNRMLAQRDIKVGWVRHLKIQ
jgi:hypothetical protein